MGDTDDGNQPARNPRRDNRVAAVQFLYMWDVNKLEALPSMLDEFFDHQGQSRDFYAFAEELVRGTIDDVEKIDQVIRKYATNWDFNRIAKVDLAILRLALYELLHRPDIPPIVSINEAIDLTKILSHQDARRFVNGILDQVKSTLKRPLRSSDRSID